MTDDPIVQELHRHRQELFQEFGNDPAALLRHLQEGERRSNRLVLQPPPPVPSQHQPRHARR